MCSVDSLWLEPRDRDNDVYGAVHKGGKYLLHQKEEGGLWSHMKNRLFISAWILFALYRAKTYKDQIDKPI
ncbi:MAG: hypothetical protein ACFFDI_06495 [Promethearchaeota archaeon]